MRPLSDCEAQHTSCVMHSEQRTLPARMHSCLGASAMLGVARRNKEPARRATGLPSRGLASQPGGRVSYPGRHALATVICRADAILWGGRVVLRRWAALAAQPSPSTPTIPKLRSCCSAETAYEQQLGNLRMIRAKRAVRVAMRHMHKTGRQAFSL